MEDFDYVVAIGASAGGLSALKDLIGELSFPLNAPIIIAIHSNEKSRLTEVLKLLSDLNIKIAEHNEKLKSGWIYVVPGATHLFFKQGTIALSNIVKDSGFRPSIDAMFMTLAAEYQDKAIAVVLSGTLSDGMRGAQVVYDMGGNTIVQDPQEAIEAGMPQSIILSDHPTAVKEAKKLGEWLINKIGYIQKQ